MELHNFEAEYLQGKNLSYFEEVDTRRKSSPHHIYMVDSWMRYNKLWQN